MTHYRNTDGGKSSVFYRLADDIIWEDFRSKKNIGIPIDLFIG